MVATRAPVVGLSADGSRVAFVTGATRTDCHHITVWRPAQESLLHFSPSLPAPCPEYGDGRIYGVKLAGTRVAWVNVLSCGNSCDVALESATLGGHVPISLRLSIGGFGSGAKSRRPST